jgi:hypothetical protein
MNRLGVGQLNNFVVISLVPLVFLAVEELLLCPRIITSLLFALALFLQFSAGNPHIFVYSSFALVIYFGLSLIFLFNKERDSNLVKKRFLFSLLGLAIFLPLILGGLLPQHEFASLTTRTRESLAYSSSLSMPIHHLITAVFPTIYGSPTAGNYFGAANYWELGLYCGILPLILALIGAIFVRGRHKTIFVILALFSLLFSLGKYTPFFALCYRLVPLFRRFRIPPTYLFLYGFAVAILAGSGANWLIENGGERRGRRFRLYLIILVMVSIAIGMLLILFPPQTTELLEKTASVLYPKKVTIISAKLPLIYQLLRRNITLFLLFFTTGGLTIFFALKGRLKRGACFFLLTTIIIADLFLLHLPFAKTEKVEEILAPIPAIDFLKGDKSRFRILDLVRIRQHLTGHYDVEKITGAHPLVLKRYIEFTNLIAGLKDSSPGEMLPLQRVKLSAIKNLHLLSLLNVKYIVAAEAANDPNLEEVFHQKTVDKKGKPFIIHIYRNKKVLPRAFIVKNAVVIKDKDKILARLLELDFKKTVILEEDVADLSNEGKEAKAKVVSYSPNRLVVAAKLNSPGYLVLSEILYPGWQAYEKGEKLPLLRANYILRALYLPPGDHRITLVFKPRSYILGRSISLSVLITLSFFLLLILYYRR